MYDQLFVSKVRENVPQIDFQGDQWLPQIPHGPRKIEKPGTRVFSGHGISFFSRDLKTSCNLRKEHSTLNNLLNAQPHQRSLAIGVARYRSSRKFLPPQRVCHSHLSKRVTAARFRGRMREFIEVESNVNGSCALSMLVQCLASPKKATTSPRTTR